MTLSSDRIDALAGIAPDSPLDELRRRRPVTREQLQASYDALFSPVDDTDFTATERALVAAFATRLTAQDETAAAYAEAAAQTGVALAELVLEEADAAAVSGPYGDFVEAGLQGENADGLRYEPSDDVTAAVGERLAAALAHTHLLTFRPREAHDEALDRLLAAGWSVDGIVTLSQLVSFLAFQQRVAAGLRVLSATTQKEVAA